MHCYEKVSDNYFDKYIGNRALLTKQEWIDKIIMELYQRKLPNNAPKWDFLKSAKLVGLFPVATSLLVFTTGMVDWLLVLKVNAELDGKRASSTKLTILIKKNLQFSLI